MSTQPEVESTVEVLNSRIDPIPLSVRDKGLIAKRDSKFACTNTSIRRKEVAK